MQEIHIETCQKKKKNRKYQRDRCHVNIDLNERLKQYQRIYYASNKKIKALILCIA